MKIINHSIKETGIAEVSSEEMLICSADDGLDLLGNLYYSNYDKIIIHQKNISPEFFDLKSGIAGEILQKFSNYKVRLAIVGNFTQYNSKSLNDFIYESNKGGQINFVNSIEEALEKLSKTNYYE